ncbi:hypothetical protein MMC22_004045 [Lobaria immixta]|nr:hypothetical protein [Lobaria immixta]
MLGLKTVFTAFAVAAFTVPFTFASSTPSRTTRPFTVQAYQPYTDGPGLTGYYLHARDGFFYLARQASNPQLVLSVDNYGLATLVSSAAKTAAKIFIDTVDGHLGYTVSSTPPAGALFDNFLHRGAGHLVKTTVETGIIGPPGDFQWLGSEGSFWLVCGSDLKIYKRMTDPVPPAKDCELYGVILSALDV